MPADRTAPSSSGSRAGSSATGLRYPAASSPAASSSKTDAATTTTSSSSSLTLSDCRLFVGNLAPSVTEYDLLVLFQPHGTLQKLDIVFHRTGPERGKPKGFAFVELATADQAARAQKAVEGKLIKGRELRVRYATADGSSEGNESSSSISPRSAYKAGTQQKRAGLDASRNMLARPAASVRGNKVSHTADKFDNRIAAMEAKLEEMRRARERQSGGHSADDECRASSSTPGLKAHPSLPAKPPSDSSLSQR